MVAYVKYLYSLKIYFPQCDSIRRRRMKLKGFEVLNFRSIIKSGWIDTDDITALVGTNESGKTNVLLPLWKLNPVSFGTINLLADMPRNKFAQMRSTPKEHVFIEAKYELSDYEQDKLVEIVPKELSISFSEIVVKKDYSGGLHFSFPNQKPIDINMETIDSLLQQAQEKIIVSEQNIPEEDRQEKTETILNFNDLTSSEVPVRIDKICSKLKPIIPNDNNKDILTQLNTDLQELKKEFTSRQLTQNTLVCDWIKINMPKYVYYSNYGNLDSQIRFSEILPKLAATNLSEKEEAKVRTLNTLFNFVGLKPSEISQLGTEINPNKELIVQNKDERLALLNSASAGLTQQFREWWKQGEYHFRLFADGDFFRILVSDQIRPEEINLEARSTGLQWFFSFFLVFLTESTRENKNTILLLDEPGVTLHPTAQKDLLKFFHNLSQSNQLLYTTHSPFMVDAGNLEQVRSVYINKSGESVVSSNLRASEKEYGIDQTKSIFSVHAALGLTVSDTLLVNCNPILVEGPSDIIYFSAIKNLLINKGKIKPLKEMVFISTGGTKGTKTTASIVSGKNDINPFVILDGDKAGKDKKKELEKDLYVNCKNRIIDIASYTIQNGEVEDLFPKKKIAETINSLFFRSSSLDADFQDRVDEKIPIIDQVKSFAQENLVELPPENDWKVKLAETVKKEILNGKEKIIGENDQELEKLVNLFSLLLK